MRKIDYTDPMSMYRSGKTAKVVTEQELAEQKAKREWTHQLNFCKWLKQTYPEIRFRSDVQSAGKLSAQMQNIMQILDPWKSWPDVQIYSPKWGYIGLFIELKRMDSGTFLKDGSLSKSKHVQEQAQMHDKLRSLGYKVEIAEGFEQAKQILDNYMDY